jgi:hypothetical protein
VNELLIDIRDLILAARKAVVRSVDLIQVLTNFEIGRRLVEHEQQGKERAEYGTALLKALSVELTTEFGRGFSRSNLEYMRKFFLTYQERAARISEMASGKSWLPLKEPKTLPVNATNPHDSQIALGKLVSPFKLGWSQYVFLIAIDNPDERSFYEIESANNGWTLPELKRQFNASLYERLALSRDQEGIRRLTAAGQTITRPEDLLKEPYSLGGNHLAQRRQYPCAEIFALFAGQGISAVEIGGMGRKY